MNDATKPDAHADLRGDREQTRADRAYAVALIAVLVLGGTLRTLGYFNDELGLWFDEALWGNRAISGRFLFSTRPMGYMWLTHQVGHVFDWSTQSLRSLSYVSGLLSLPVLYALLREILQARWLCIFGTYVLAVNRVAVGMSKEFKPYSLGLFLCLLLLWVAARYAKRNALGALIFFACVAPFTFLLSYSVALIFPAVYLVTLGAALSRRAYRAFAGISLSALVGMGIAAAVYKARLSEVSDEESRWANKYGVFPSGESAYDNATWYIKELADLLMFPSSTKWAAAVEWAVPYAVAILFIGSVAGIYWAWRRRDAVTGGLLIVPFATIILISSRGLWPFGQFRTNTFTLAMSIPLCIYGLDGIYAAARKRVRRKRRIRVDALCTATILALVLTMLPYAFDRYAQKEAKDLSSSSSIPAVMREVVASMDGAPAGQRVPVYMDWHGCRITKSFYLTHDAKMVREVAPKWKARVKHKCPRRLLRGLAAKTGPYWAVAAGHKDSAALAKFKTDNCKDLHIKRFPTGTTLVHCRDAAAPAEKQSAPAAKAKPGTPAPKAKDAATPKVQPAAHGASKATRAKKLPSKKAADQARKAR